VCAALCDVGVWVCFMKGTVLEVVVLMASAKLTHGQAGQAPACRCAVCSIPASAMQLFAGGVTARLSLRDIFTEQGVAAWSLKPCVIGLRVYIPWLCVGFCVVHEVAGHVRSCFSSCISSSSVLHAGADLPFGGKVVSARPDAHIQRDLVAESQQMDLMPVAVQLCAWPSGMPCTLPLLHGRSGLSAVACVHLQLFVGSSFFCCKGISVT
jgi:hypothetical protein